jgi:hypothetical protein
LCPLPHPGLAAPKAQDERQNKEARGEEAAAPAEQGNNGGNERQTGNCYQDSWADGENAVWGGRPDICAPEGDAQDEGRAGEADLGRPAHVLSPFHPP